jgi:hypothetical protein
MKGAVSGKENKEELRSSIQGKGRIRGDQRGGNNRGIGRMFPSTSEPDHRVEEAIKGMGSRRSSAAIWAANAHQRDLPAFSCLTVIKISMDGRGRWMDNVFIKAAVGKSEARRCISEGLRINRRGPAVFQGVF